MKNFITYFLVAFTLLFLPITSYADDLFRGYGFDALTVDREEKLAELVALVTDKNVNSFRAQYFNRDVDENFNNDSDKGAEKYLDWVENTVLPHFANLKARLDPYNVTIMLALHTPVGGRDVSVSPPVDRMFADDDLMDTQIEAWTMIAEVYNGDPSVIYQIFSEPATTASKWREFYTDLIEDISEEGNVSSETRQKVVVMSPYGNPNLVRGVTFTDLSDVYEYVLGVNFYAPHEYTHQGTTATDDSWERFSYPSSVNVRNCDKQQARFDKAKNAKKKKKKRIRKLKRKLKSCLRKRKKDLKQAGDYHIEGLRKILSKAVKSAEKKGVELLVPEYAAPNYASGVSQYVADLTSLFDEYEISSFWHILYEAEVWDPLKLCNPSISSCEDVQSSDLNDTLNTYFQGNDFD